MRKPIACSLDGSSARDQVDRWRAALTAAVITTERVDAQTVEMRLRPDADVAAIIALAQREIACCPFFGFTINLDADGATFVTTVPADAAPILDAFATLGPR
jgi:MerR family transcriptional regulator, copper efflux regulator